MVWCRPVVWGSFHFREGSEGLAQLDAFSVRWGVEGPYGGCFSLTRILAQLSLVASISARKGGGCVELLRKAWLKLAPAEMDT